MDQRVAQGTRPQVSSSSDLVVGEEKMNYICCDWRLIVRRFMLTFDGDFLIPRFGVLKNFLPDVLK